jgi:hypothetical protein
MSKKIIDIGSGELAGDGESIRSAFSKINDNFTEVYHGGIGGTGIGVYSSDTPPEDAIDNELWWNTENGKLYIRYMDSWIEANTIGPNGEVGFTGSQGIIGYIGSRGNIGYIGSRGNTGYAGSKGDIGETGADGFTGSKGFTGSRGLGYTGSASTVIGYSGSVGYAGSQGVGYTGSQGPFGEVTVEPSPPTSGNLWWDPIGGNLYIKYGDQWISAITIDPNSAYTPSNPGIWNSPVHTIFEALDHLALRLWNIEHP